jgi:hypothetical protein
VLLDLGARPNQQPQHTRSGNTHDSAAGSPNRSGRFPKLVRPLLLDLASHRKGKLVRPVRQIDQAGSVQKLPTNNSEGKPASRTSPPLNKNSHRTTGTSLLRNSSRQPTGLNRSDRFWPGQLGRTQLAGKTQTFHQSIPIRSTDQSETLGIDGVPRGLPLARSSVPKTHSTKRNQKSTLKNTFPWKPPKTPKSKPFRRVCWIKITKQRGTRSLYVTSNKNPSRKHPKIFPTEIPRKGSENHQKGKREEHKQALRNHAESSIHTMKGSYKV